MSPQQLAYRAAHYTPWYERIGDGGPVAWIITFAYLAAAVLCFLAARRSLSEPRPERTLWLAAAGVVLFLALNKQLDLQVGLIEFWRENALASGWYGARRTVQLVAFGTGLVAAGFAAWWLLPVMWRQGGALKAAFAGLALIGIYIFLRAAEFQHVLWDGPGPHGPGWLSALELGGIAIVAVAAWRARRPRFPEPPRSRPRAGA